MNHREKAKEIHESVNHTYGGYNYVLHLDATSAVANEFYNDFYTYHSLKGNGIMSMEEIDLFFKSSLWQAIYFHDVIEDCRYTYNDVKELIGETAAEIVYALSNDKGRTRAERASDSYYEGIRNTTGASFVKMCDRIANVRFSRMMGSSMYNKYRKENDHFMESVDADRYPNMKQHLINLFNV